MPCSGCLYFHGFHKECRRFPPTHDGFPRVDEKDWCGEHKALAKDFEPPTLSEISDYCRDRKNGIDAAAFFAFYEAKGWKVGRTKMKDWKAAVRTWEQKNAERQRNGKQTAAERNAALDDHLAKRMRDG